MLESPIECFGCRNLNPGSQIFCSYCGQKLPVPSAPFSVTATRVASRGGERRGPSAAELALRELTGAAQSGAARVAAGPELSERDPRGLVPDPAAIDQPARGPVAAGLLAEAASADDPPTASAPVPVTMTRGSGNDAWGERGFLTFLQNPTAIPREPARPSLAAHLAGRRARGLRLVALYHQTNSET